MSVPSTPSRTSYGPFLRQIGGRVRGQALSKSPVTVSNTDILRPEEQPEVPTQNLVIADQEQPEEQILVQPVDVPTMSEVQVSHFHGYPGDRGDIWLAEYDDYCKCRGLNDDRKQSSFRFFLKDHARQWYLSLPETKRTNFGELTEAFKVRFNGSDGQVNIASVRQTGTESCASYFTRFLGATNQRNFPNDLLVQFAIDGLNEHIKHIVMPQNLTSLEAVRLASLRAERTLSFQYPTVAAAQPSVDILVHKIDRLTEVLSERKVTEVYAAHPYQQAQQNKKPDSTCCDGFLLGATVRVLFLLMILCPATLVQGEILQRLNYGVVFQKESQLTLAREYWLHTFELPMPEHVNIPLIGTCQKSDEECLTINHVLSQINSVRLETYNRMNITLKLINDLVPELKIKRARSRRSLLPFIGQFSKTLFGTATVDDVNTLAKHINSIQSRTSKLANALKQQSSHLSSYMSQTNERMDNLMKGIRANNAGIQYINTQIIDTASNLQKSFDDLMSTLIQQLRTSGHLNHEFDQLSTAISNLVNGKLSPVLVPNHILGSTLNDIQSILNEKFYGFHIAVKNISDFYHASNYLYARNGSNLYITIKIPITYTRDSLDLYKVISLPVPINDTSKHATALPDLPKYFVITKNHQFYLTLTDEEISKCKGASDKQCTFNVPLIPVTKDSCMLALFTNNKDKIHSLCEFRFLHNAINSKILELKSNKVLLYQTPLFSLECGQEHRMVQGCNYCIFDLPCQCSLTTANFYLPPRLTSCLNHTREITKLHPVNLVLLQEFFDNDKFRHIFADTMLHKPANFTIPHFKFYQHKMKSIIANDRKSHLSLSKIVQKAKKDETIFQTLAEPMLDGQITVPQQWPEVSDILMIVTVALSSLAIIAIFLMYLKMKKLAATLLIIQQVQQIKALPTSLPTFVYQHPTLSTEKPFIIKIDLGWEHAAFLFTVLNTILLVLLILKLSTTRKSTSIILEVTGFQQCLFIPIMQLSLCPSHYCFEMPQEISELELCGPWYSRKLKLQWPHFSISNQINEQKIDVPKIVSINWIAARKLEQIMKQQFFLNIYAQHNGQLLPISAS